MPVAEGGEIALWCMAQTSNPPVTIIWKEDGHPFTLDHETITKSIEGEFHGREVRSEVVLKVVDKDVNGKIVTCLPEFGGTPLKKLSHQFVLNVTCK